jgi:hypothetical protein
MDQPLSFFFDVNMTRAFEILHSLDIPDFELSIDSFTRPFEEDVALLSSVLNSWTSRGFPAGNSLSSKDFVYQSQNLTEASKQACLEDFIDDSRRLLHDLANLGSLFVPFKLTCNDSLLVVSSLKARSEETKVFIRLIVVSFFFNAHAFFLFFFL